MTPAGPAGPARRIVIVGNGPTGLADDGSHHVDLTCGHFLRDLAAAGFDVSFLQPVEPLSLKLNYYGYILSTADAKSIGLDRRTPKSALRTGLAALRALVRAEFVYLFYPGRLPSLIGRLCRALRKPYGIYLRGERYAVDGTEGRLLGRARFILVASRGLVEPASRVNPNVALFRPMVELSAADSVRTDFRARAAGPLKFLFVGRIEADKGVPELVEAADLLRRRGLEFDLRLAGLGELHPELSKRYPPGNADGISILGAVEDRQELMRLYEQADLFVFPTHHEGFPRVLYEAMLKSAVVVTTMVGGIPGLLRDNENCLAVPVGEPAAIAETIERLASDPELRQRLADSARKTAIEVLEESPSHAEALRHRLEQESGSIGLGDRSPQSGAFHA